MEGQGHSQHLKVLQHHHQSLIEDCWVILARKGTSVTESVTKIFTATNQDYLEGQGQSQHLLILFTAQNIISVKYSLPLRLCGRTRSKPAASRKLAAALVI